ncbi:MAG: C1 family peptidase [Bacteroidales bacterium]|nr:C1 family peptidase [Bacteroidales bacterium]MDD3892421.1 C1 family peptidase [Bacteroidales bacterium]
MRKLNALILLISFSLALTLTATAQNEESIKGYDIKDKLEVKYTSVKNQHRSGTCWSYSGLALIESDILRKGKPEVNLSPMYIVRNTYSDKATKYVRFHGSLNFAGGGSFYDVVESIKRYGIVPEEIFAGLNYGEEMNVHGELDAVTKAYVNAVIENKNRKLSTAWKRGFDGILDAYFGETPKTFNYNGKDYTPESFAKSLGVNYDDYIYISSFTHHPFYEKFIIEVPDNWALGEVHNLPLDAFMSVFDHALENGYAIAWASDVSEKGFSYPNGVAIVPEVNIDEMSDSEKSKWTTLSDREKESQLYTFDKPGKEKLITQELRQEAFDNYTTTDDHGMLIVGIAHDQIGNKYYKVKNSWGTSDKHSGFFYASEAFVRYKTMSIMINKNSIPKQIAKKLNL